MVDYTLGINSYFMATRWPRPEEKFALVREKLDLDCLQYSLDGFETGWPTDYRNRLVKEIQNASARYQVNIHSVFTGCGHHDNSFFYHPDKSWREYALAWFKAAVRFASKIGAKGAGGFTGALSATEASQPTVRRKRIKEAIDLLTVLSEDAASCGLEFLLIEPMSVVREPPSTVEETLEIVEKINQKAALPVRLCLDVGHHRTTSLKGKKECDPAYWLRQCGRWVEAIHLHQTDLQASRHWPFTREYNSVGIVQPEKIIRAIEEAGAVQMTLLIEIFVPAFEPRDNQALEEALASVNFWKKVLPHKIIRDKP
ncbi:MAG: sugar phosphate isomerase/epimerase [Candidatus Omnitrophica bacterium]|nr:sugar phosphate isomerase/epimerase [Candidatus Omnitrophota bacterium]